MSHTFEGKKANIFFDNGFDRSGEVEFIDKETGQKVKIDVDDLMRFIEEEYEPYNKPVQYSEFVGLEIANFYCNGFFGREYDLAGSVVIDNTHDSLTVRTTEGIVRTAYFNDGWETEMRKLVKEWSEDDGFDY